ncbi:hypothetical protein BDR26DRAFT_162 [Obelidium mucronatum]|nr:hypothetical protein BDR26DRAFT_162 [Obelidium mucronatum]
MSTYKDQSLQVAISTNGNGPRLASKSRKQIVNSIPTHAGAALESLAKLRQLLKQADSVPREFLDLVTGDLMVIPADAEKPSDSMLHAALRALELGQNVIRLKSGSEWVNVEQDDEFTLFAQKGFKAVVVPCVSATAALVAASSPVAVASDKFTHESAPVAVAREVSPVVIPTVYTPAPVSAVRAAGSPQLISGQDAAAHVAYALSDLSFVYPVIPESTIGKSVSEWSAAGVKNAHGKFHKTAQIETRGGAVLPCPTCFHQCTKLLLISCQWLCMLLLKELPRTSASTPRLLMWLLHPSLALLPLGPTM